MNDFSCMEDYGGLLQRLDAWFCSIRAQGSGQMQCRRGCIQCCLGVFDIGLPDAVRLAEAFALLPEETQSRIARRAAVVQDRIRHAGPELEFPFFLNMISQGRVDQIAECVPDARCIFLDDDDSCIIYEKRPLACRLEGIPMVDFKDGLFGDWCALNFREGVSSEFLKDLRLDYYEMQDIERDATRCLSQRMLGKMLDEAPVFIPSIIASFNGFWKSRLPSRLAPNPHE